MAGYIPSNVPRKKAVMLERREKELLREIRTGIESDLLYEAAEKVREAHLGYLKGKRHFAAYPNADDQLRGRKIDLEMEDWRREPVEVIITEYKKHSDS